MSDSRTPKFLKVEDPADKMAELEREIEMEDDALKYGPKTDADSDDSPSGDDSEPQPPVEGKSSCDDESEKKEGKEEQEHVPAPDAAEDGGDKHGEAEKETEGTAEAPSEKKPDSGSSNSLWVNVAIGACVLFIGAMGYLYYQQQQQMPLDPLEEAILTRNALRAEHEAAEFENIEVQKLKLRKQELMIRTQYLAELTRGVEAGKKKIEDLEREIMGLRGQMKSYYALYKEHARKNARNLHFDSLTTVNTKKTYLDVSISRVTDQEVSIVHAGGATKLAPSDLTEALQARLAFGDPLGLENFDADKAQDDEIKKNIGKNVPNAADFNGAGKASPARKETINNEAILNRNFDPPSKLPNVDTSTRSDAERDATLNDGWVPPAASGSFVE